MARLCALFLIPAIIVLVGAAFWLGNLAINSATEGLPQGLEAGGGTTPPLRTPTSVIMLFRAALEQVSGFGPAIFVGLLALPALLHIAEGIENIIQDYVHHKRTKILCLLLCACAYALVYKYACIFIFL